MKKHVLVVMTLAVLSFAVVWTTAAEAQELKLSNAKGFFYFAVIGDTGIGGVEQY